MLTVVTADLPLLSISARYLISPSHAVQLAVPRQGAGILAGGHTGTQTPSLLQFHSHLGYWDPLHPASRRRK